MGLCELIDRSHSDCISSVKEVFKILRNRTQILEFDPLRVTPRADLLGGVDGIRVNVLLAQWLGTLITYLRRGACAVVATAL